MLKHTVLRALALSLPMLMFACRGIPNPDFAFMGRFQKGELRSTIDSIKNADPKYTFELSGDGSMKATTVDVYRMVLGKRSPFYLAIFGGSKTIYNLIAFAYQNNSLVYCGTVDDFSKSTNPEVLAIASKLNDALMKEF